MLTPVILPPGFAASYRVIAAGEQGIRLQLDESRCVVRCHVGALAESPPFDAEILSLDKARPSERLEQRIVRCAALIGQQASDAIAGAGFLGVGRKERPSGSDTAQQGNEIAASHACIQPWNLGLHWAAPAPM
jgi:hypothetical protein